MNADPEASRRTWSSEAANKFGRLIQPPRPGAAEPQLSSEDQFNRRAAKSAEKAQREKTLLEIRDPGDLHYRGLFHGSPSGAR